MGYLQVQFLNNSLNFFLCVYKKYFCFTILPNSAITIVFMHFSYIKNFFSNFHPGSLPLKSILPIHMLTLENLFSRISFSLNSPRRLCIILAVFRRFSSSNAISSALLNTHFQFLILNSHLQAVSDILIQLFLFFLC